MLSYSVSITTAPRAFAARRARLVLRFDRGMETVFCSDVFHGRKRSEGLEFSHVMNLAAAFEDVDALLCGDNRVTVKIRAALLEFGEVLNRLQGPLRSE